MQNRLPTAMPDPNEWDMSKPLSENLLNHYQFNQQMYRSRVEAGEAPEAVRDSLLMGLDLINAIAEASILDAFDGVSAPDQAVETAIAAFPAFTRPGDN